MDAQAGARCVGLWPRREPDIGRLAAGALSGHSAGAWLSGFARPHRKGHSFRAAGCGALYRYHAHRKFRHAAGRFDLRIIFFASTVALLCRGQDRTRSGARLSAPQRPGTARHRALARTLPELRARRGLASTRNVLSLTLPRLSLRVTDSRAAAISDNLELGCCARMPAESAEQCHRNLRFGHGADPIHLFIHKAKTHSRFADRYRAPWRFGGRDILRDFALQLSLR